MAGIQDILEIERGRSEPQEWMQIHLFQEGSFYRAYEVSAWLCHVHISEFKVTHRHVKGIEQSIVFVGFPVTSLEKRMPEGATADSVSEKHVVITLPLPETGIAADDIKNEFAAWKSRQPMTSSKDNRMTETKSDISVSSKDEKRSLFSVAQNILSFPIESHSPIDCMIFLSEVKKDLAQIL